MVDSGWNQKLTSAHLLTLPLKREGETLPSAMLATVTDKDIGLLLEKYPSFLNVHERGFFDSIQDPQRRENYLLARFAGKRALGRYLRESDPTKIELTSGILQQPVVRYPVSHVPDVSLTHTRGYGGALAFPKVHPMAIDFEVPDPAKLEQFRSNCLPRELKLAASLIREEALRWTLVWTIKEALSKILRSGWSCPFGIFEIESLTAAGGGFQGDYKHFAAYRFYAWQVHDLIGAVVLPKKTELGLGPAELRKFFEEAAAIAA